jgi:hypothetical protein
MNIESLPARFRSKYSENADTGCWDWSGTLLGNGYGQYYVGGGQKNRVQVLAHRFAFECCRGAIPEGLCIDHLCRNRGCVNPDHMEPVTRGENVLRGVGRSAKNARKTHCKRGHEFTPENTYVYNKQRACKACQAGRSRGDYYRRGEYHQAYRRSERNREVQRRYRERKRLRQEVT